MHREVKRQSLRDIREDHWEVLLPANLSPRTGPDSASCLDQEVIEHLRLRVPKGTQQAWLEAEQKTWDPWLRRQQGFLGRELLWDGQRQEGVLLIHWASHLLWKAIPADEVVTVHENFVGTAKELLNLPPESENPFPLVYEGEATLP